MLPDKEHTDINICFAFSGVYGLSNKNVHFKTCATANILQPRYNHQENGKICQYLFIFHLCAQNSSEQIQRAPRPMLRHNLAFSRRRHILQSLRWVS